MIYLTIYITIALFFIQLTYWLLFSRLLLWKPNQTNTTNHDHISLIICAKNEGDQLVGHLKGFLNQDIANYEVILVDDFSTDDTKNIISTLQKSYTNLVYVVPDNNVQGKKAALQAGIQAAKHKILAFSDADCIPSSQNWLKTMRGEFSIDKEIVLAYSPYMESSGMLNKWIRFEAFLTAVQYLGFANIGIPYMGVGRNLMYRKESFIDRSNIKTHMDLISGDDDLTINQMATAQNTAICLNPDSFIYSEPKRDLRSYFKQKIRHYSTAHRYRWVHQGLLAGFSISHILFVLFTIVLLSYSVQWAICIYLLRLAVLWLIHIPLLTKFREKGLLIYFPLLDLILVFYYSLFSIFVLFPKNSKWS